MLCIFQSPLLSAIVAPLLTAVLVAGAASPSHAETGQLTGCLKGGRLSNLAIGSTPSAPCRTSKGEVEVTLNSPPDFGELQTQIDANEDDIATNAAGISTNAGGISSNAAGIGANAGGISSNAAWISTNAGVISSNAAGIGTNAGGISSNAALIDSNTTRVASNDDAIGDLQADVDQALADIGQLENAAPFLGPPSNELTLSPDASFCCIDSFACPPGTIAIGGALHTTSGFTSVETSRNNGTDKWRFSAFTLSGGATVVATPVCLP
jgi:hypothetical protein